MHIRNGNKTSGWNISPFHTLKYKLASEWRPDHMPKNQLLLRQRSIFNE